MKLYFIVALFLTSPYIFCVSDSDDIPDENPFQIARVASDTESIIFRIVELTILKKVNEIDQNCILEMDYLEGHMAHLLKVQDTIFSFQGEESSLVKELKQIYQGFIVNGVLSLMKMYPEENNFSKLKVYLLKDNNIFDSSPILELAFKVAKSETTFYTGTTRRKRLDAKKLSTILRDELFSLFDIT